MVTCRNSRRAIAAALAGAVALIVSFPAWADEREKCYGIAKAGENDCASDMGSHMCAGQSTEDYYGGDWVLVPEGTCRRLGGQTAPFDGYGSPG